MAVIDVPLVAGLPAAEHLPLAEDLPLAEVRAIEQAAQRLAERHPGADPAVARRLLWERFHETRDARVQNFRLVLAERAAGRDLAALCSRGGMR
jgi:hypothetical protein